MLVIAPDKTMRWDTVLAQKKMPNLNAAKCLT